MCGTHKDTRVNKCCSKSKIYNKFDNNIKNVCSKKATQDHCVWHTNFSAKCTKYLLFLVVHENTQRISSFFRSTSHLSIDKNLLDSISFLFVSRKFQWICCHLWMSEWKKVGKTKKYTHSLATELKREY